MELSRTPTAGGSSGARRTLKLSSAAPSPQVAITALNDVEPVVDEHPGHVGEQRRPVSARDVDLPLVVRERVQRDPGFVSPGEPFEQLHLARHGLGGLREQVRRGAHARCGSRWQRVRDEAHRFGAPLLDQVARLEPGQARLLEHRHDQ